MDFASIQKSKMNAVQTDATEKMHEIITKLCELALLVDQPGGSIVQLCFQVIQRKMGLLDARDVLTCTSRARWMLEDQEEMKKKQ